MSTFLYLFVATGPISSGDRTILALREPLRPRKEPPASSSGSTLALIDMKRVRFEVARFVNVGRAPPRSVFCALGSLDDENADDENTRGAWTASIPRLSTGGGSQAAATGAPAMSLSGAVIGAPPIADGARRRGSPRGGEDASVKRLLF